GRECLDALNQVFLAIGRQLPNQERDLIGARGQKTAQLRAEPSSGEIRQTPDFIQRFVGRTSSHDTVHVFKIQESLRSVELSLANKPERGVRKFAVGENARPHPNPHSQERESRRPSLARPAEPSSVAAMRTDANAKSQNPKPTDRLRGRVP